MRFKKHDFDYDVGHWGLFGGEYVTLAKTVVLTY